MVVFKKIDHSIEWSFEFSGLANFCLALFPESWIVDVEVEREYFQLSHLEQENSSKGWLQDVGFPCLLVWNIGLVQKERLINEILV